MSQRRPKTVRMQLIERDFPGKTIEEIISQIGQRYVKQDLKRQRSILRHVVSKVVINLEGEIIRLELQPPFVYLSNLANSIGGGGTEEGAS